MKPDDDSSVRMHEIVSAALVDLTEIGDGRGLLRVLTVRLRLLVSLPHVVNSSRNRQEKFWAEKWQVQTVQCVLQRKYRARQSLGMSISPACLYSCTRGVSAGAKYVSRAQ